MTFQRWNTTSKQRWNMMLKQRWNMTLKQRWNMTLKQRWNMTSFQRWNLTLFQRWNLTLFQCWNLTLFQRWNLTLKQRRKWVVFPTLKSITYQRWKLVVQRRDLKSTIKQRLNNVVCRCRIEFWPHWILTRGVLIQRAVLRIQQIFHVELRPPRQGVIVLRPLRRIKFGPPLNCDPGSWFHIE